MDVLNEGLMEKAETPVGWYGKVDYSLPLFCKTLNHLKISD